MKIVKPFGETRAASIKKTLESFGPLPADGARDASTPLRSFPILEILSLRELRALCLEPRKPPRRDTGVIPVVRQAERRTPGVSTRIHVIRHCIVRGSGT